jgi:hypothetical protein
VEVGGGGAAGGDERIDQGRVPHRLGLPAPPAVPAGVMRDLLVQQRAVDRELQQRVEHGPRDLVRDNDEVLGPPIRIVGVEDLVKLVVHAQTGTGPSVLRAAERCEGVGSTQRFRHTTNDIEHTVD